VTLTLDACSNDELVPFITMYVPSDVPPLAAGLLPPPPHPNENNTLIVTTTAKAKANNWNRLATLTSRLLENTNVPTALVNCP
jgi:hypothetical protein